MNIGVRDWEAKGPSFLEERRWMNGEEGQLHERS